MIDANAPKPRLSHLTLHMALLYPATPLDESTRKALANLLIYLWGECGAKLPDYDKKA